MSALNSIPVTTVTDQESYRLINSKFPPIDLFNDVADNDEFEAIYAVQGLTNPRLRNSVGQIRLVPEDERPFGIPGCNYALGPFVHLNPAGSRFSDGSFGVLYSAADESTSVAETKYHQEKYFRNVQGLHYDSLCMRTLKVVYSADLFDISDANPEWQQYRDPDDYTAPRILGGSIRQAKKHGLLYQSVRQTGHLCFALFTPILVSSVIQTSHYVYEWDGTSISATRKMA